MTFAYTREVERLGRSNRRVQRLRRAVKERPQGLVVVDGRRLVEDLIRWGVELTELYVAESMADTAAGWAAAEGERVFLLADEVLSGLAPTRHPQGVLAVAPEPRWPRWRPEGLVLGLDEVQEPGNVGAIVRSAAAMGAASVLLGPGCADPFHPAAVRGSAGGVFRVPVYPGRDLGEAMGAVRKAGGSVWAAGAGGISAREWRPRRPSLLLLGSEGRGLSPRLARAADGVVGVPLLRRMDSLNVAVAAGILLWAAAAGEPAVLDG